LISKFQEEHHELDARHRTKCLESRNLDDIETLIVPRARDLGGFASGSDSCVAFLG
jgi:hypothetical protein